VRESSGTYAYECFTDADYAEFQKNKVAEKTAVELMGKPDMQAAMAALRKLPASDAGKLLEQWRQPLHKTWAELGMISAAGQTEAGQRAEIDIANAIINMIQKQ